MLNLPFQQWAVRDMSSWKVFMGMTEDNQDEYMTALSFASAPADEAWVFACVRRKYLDAQSVPLRVLVRTGDGWTPAAELNDQAASDLQWLLDDVNPYDMNGADLKAYTVAGLNVWGGGYWKKVRGRLLRDVQELYWLRVPDVTPVSANGRWADMWRYHPTSGASEMVEPRDMIVFRTPNLSNPLEPLSPLSSVRWDLAVGKEAPKSTASVLKNWGIPPGVFIVPKDAEFTSADRSLVRRALAALRGPKNQGKTAVLPQGLEWQQLAINPKDAEWLAARKASRMAVCAVLGVPLPLAGDDEKQSVYAAVRDAERVFWLNTMIPELDWYADVINGWLVPDFDPVPRGKPHRLMVAWDYSAIEAIQPVWQERVEGMTQLLDRRVVVANEVRATLRLGGPVPWGNEPNYHTTVNLSSPADPEIVPGAAESEVPEPPAPDAGELDITAQLRTIGRNLYRALPVRAFVAHGGPLNADALLGRQIPDAARLAIEDGLRRRNSAEQIATALQESRHA